MGKTAACIKMIQILNCRDLVTTAELADILETNQRNIKEYIKELELAGYTVESVRGKNGGYRLDKSEVFPSLKLLPHEKNLLQESTEFLKNCADFVNYNEYQLVMGKVLTSFGNQNEITPLTMIDRFPLAMDRNLLNERYNILNECIESQLKVEIEYNPASNKPKLHVIHPYKLFVYNGSWFILGWSERINDFGYYKLNRMNSINKTKYHFSILKTYDESKYLDQFGMKQNGEYYHIELELKDLLTVIQERIYGKNQKIEVIDEHYVKFSCEMQNKNMILSFIMSFGAKCKVLSPEWLKELHQEELLKSYQLYE